MKDVSHLRPELAEKIQNWLISFHRLDPRYLILTFFSQVAQEGADRTSLDDEYFEEDLVDGQGGHHHRLQSGEYPDDRLMYESQRRALRNSSASTISLQTSSRQLASNLQSASRKVRDLLNNAFSRSSILTVWRPTSKMAMRYMMQGTGVGKGLDVKGKSAKKGRLSALVPYLQIHTAADIPRIQPIPPQYQIRVYFASSEARHQAMEALQVYIPADSRSSGTRVAVHLLDHYSAKGIFGIQAPQALVWKVFVQDAATIERSGDLITGRPSTPGFQDAHHKALQKCEAFATSPPPSEGHIPVIFQLEDKIPLQPQTLVMAYEENGTVTPVVSDFDAFLMGWRREALWFGCNLPREQEALMLWCLEHIEAILDEQQEQRSSSKQHKTATPPLETWTSRWLRVLKEEASHGFIPEIPEYGFGDPKSYSIMEEAARRLIDTGAVRHGSESFNYYFPQEMDDEFLVISDTFRPVPWKYVGVQELQEVLSEKIAQGFVFPLNPKWILCDPGWKALYDQLMESEALYAEMSKDVWFPPWSGVRQKLQEIHAKHPHGFQQEGQRISTTSSGTDTRPLSPTGEEPEEDSGNQQQSRLSAHEAYELADLELDEYVSRKGMLARQIELASRSDFEQEYSFHSLQGLGKQKEAESDDKKPIQKRQISKRSLFRLQKTDGYFLAGSSSGGDAEEEKDSSRKTATTSEKSIVSEVSAGSGVIPVGISIRDGAGSEDLAATAGSSHMTATERSRRSLMAVMHSSKTEPRRHLGGIYTPGDTTSDDDDMGMLTEGHADESDMESSISHNDDDDDDGSAIGPPPVPT